MDITQVKKRKQVLSEAIGILIERFEKDTGTRVADVSISDVPESKILAEFGLATARKKADIQIVID